jgi:hypothetical protein
MTEDAPGRQTRRRRLRLRLAVTVLGLILAVLLVPPWIGINRYKSRITQLMAASLGRPVRLSSVELRLLPQPGFVLTDLTVDEDPEFGAEPLLHATTVKASIRLLSLWRRRLEIGSISVDEASLNLVRTAGGRWNLDPLFQTAAARGQTEGGAGAKRPVKLPYLEATNSRINIKRGAEKLPFSLVNTDASAWQEEGGEWRLRLRGQPARTDVSLDLADTGVVRLEASVRRAAELRLTPVRLDLDWREAQLGQLARLVIGSDPGWRGDLTGEVHLDGTPDTAQVRTRLRATGVHRAEFAPVAPQDFDANCAFIYHFPRRAIEKLACDSPLGNGRVHLQGELPGLGAAPEFSVELDKVPATAALDMLRTFRSGIGPDLVAKGSVSGKIAYSGARAKAAGAEEPASESRRPNARSARNHTAPPGPLTGSLAVEGFELSGEDLKTPIRVPRIVLEPVAVGDAAQDIEPDRFHRPRHRTALKAAFAIPAGGAAPLAMTALFRLSSYAVTVRGQAGFARAKEMAHAVGMGNGLLDDLAGDPVTVDLSAEGPWMRPEQIPNGLALAVGNGSGPIVPAPAVQDASDSISGTLTLHNANWKAGYLNNHVEIAEATLHLDNGASRWDPVVFSYGPVKGTASLELPAHCAAPQPCLPRFEVHFGDLDASALQAAILGAREPGTLLSTLLGRLSSTPPPAWPQLEGNVEADSLILGPVTLREATATLRVLEHGAEITGLDASLLGGTVHGAGTLRAAGPGQDKPAYTLTGNFEKLSPAEVGQLIGLRCSGGVFDAGGRIELSGFSDKDLAASVKGALHFDWRHGRVFGGAASEGVPAALARFDRWTADAEIANGVIALKQSQLQTGSRKHAVEARVTIGDPARIAFAATGRNQAKR